MGHVHLGVLPRTREWREVVRLLKGTAASDEVIAAAAIAAERDLSRAAEDRDFVESVRLLLAIARAGASGSFVAGLRGSGVAVSEAPDLVELLAAVGDRLDMVATRRSDLGELSRRALLGALAQEIGARLPGLLEATPDDLRAAARALGSPRDFARLARVYFTMLIEQTLRSWLDRTLSAQVGADRAFRDAGARQAFDEALDQYCMEATRIIREFAEGWYAKRLPGGDALSTEDAGVFGYVVFKKVREELAWKRRVDA